MTKNEALRIPDLQIEPDELTEDLFYLIMANDGRIQRRHAPKAYRRIADCTDEIPLYVLDNVRRMIANIDQYGVACAAWCEQ